MNEFLKIHVDILETNRAILISNNQRNLLGAELAETNPHTGRQVAAKTGLPTVATLVAGLPASPAPTARHLRYLGRSGRFDRVHEGLHYYRSSVLFVRCRESHEYGELRW